VEAARGRVVLHSEIVTFFFQAGVLFAQIHKAEVFQHAFSTVSEDFLINFCTGAVISMTTCSTGVHDRRLPTLKR